MQEQVNEKISLLIDNELESAKALMFLRKVKEDQALKDRLQRYQAVSQVFKNEKCIIPNKDFAKKIQQQIRNEPVYDIPAKKVVINWQKTGLALAASIALAVVWVFNVLENQSKPYPVLALTASQPIQSGVMNDRFNDYLQAHDNAVYTNNAGSVQHPYARVVGYQQE